MCVLRCALLCEDMCGVSAWLCVLRGMHKVCGMCVLCRLCVFCLGVMCVACVLRE